MLSYQCFFISTWESLLNKARTIVFVCVRRYIHCLPLGAVVSYLSLSLSPKVSAAISSSGELRFLSEQDTEPELTSTK